MTKNQHGEERVFVGVTGYSPPAEEVKEAGTKQRPQRRAAYWLACAFVIPPRSIYPERALPTVVWTLLPQVANSSTEALFPGEST